MKEIRQKTGGKKKWALVFGAVLAAGLALVLIPRYSAYIRNYNAETCFQARYWVGLRYHLAIREELEAGADEDEIDYEQLLRDVVEANFTFELDENLESDDLCRGGGHCWFSINESTHCLAIYCDEGTHLWYNDEGATDEALDGLYNVDSGLSREESW